ncbi:MAG: hypothetical protein HYZ50_00580 [Deltaproteobacteria bacterium]|nr:hypothetical protein [Deltaproteobacteria bacterium]
MPQLSASHLTGIIDQLLSARERSLATCPVEDIAASLDKVATRFLTSSSVEHQEAVAGLPAETGLSPEMIRHTLPLIFADYRRDNLLALLHDELGATAALDEGARLRGKWRKAYGPSFVMQVLAGNIPGAGIDGIVFALLVKSATLVKTASSASLLPTLFARCLSEIDPDLGACLAVVTWPGGYAALEEVAFSRAEVVIASGTEESLAAIRTRVHGRFIGYGHKISFSVITKEALATGVTDLARRAAYDIALFDQQGCLSPQLVYVETGGATSPQAFAALLAQGLRHWQQVLPRGRIAPDASLTIRRVRDAAEWQALAGKEIVLHASTNGTEWTVIYDADPTFAPSPLYRTVRVKPLHTVSQLASLLQPWRPYLEAAGVAAMPAQLGPLAAELGRACVSRVCQIGTMQTPPLSWRHGGRPRIADLVRWTETELP